jgi:hypothetical protein
MKIITTKNGQIFSVTTEVFLILSWLATLEKQENSEKTYWQIWGLKTSLVCLNVSDDLVYDICINKNFSGYQNMNRLALIEYFE